MPSLEKLTVAGMSMGDEGFAAIAEIKSLRELSTWHTYQTEAGNAIIARMPLTSLKMGQRLPRQGEPPSFTGGSLATFAGIATLEKLVLTEARFTLDDLRQLKKLTSLRQLSIAECEVPEDSLAALRAELAQVKIDFEPLTDGQREKLKSYLR